MNICGKIINIKSKKNILFLLIKSDIITQIVIKSDLDNYLKRLSIGDIISCEVVHDKNNNSKYKTMYDSFELKSLYLVSKNIKNFKLVVNEENIINYSNVKYRIRKYLHRLGYLEIDLPVLTDGEVSSKSESFCTLYSKGNTKLYLRKTMDTFLRMYSCSGFNKIYSIGKCYRNEYLTSKYKPEFEMLSIFSNYLNKDKAIKIAIEIIKIITSQNVKLCFIDYEKYIKILPDDNTFYIISNYCNNINSYCNTFENNETNEFKIKYKNITVVHGVSEICNYDEYIKKITSQGRKSNYGELQILENLIASGAPQCYNLGISIVRILSLYNNLKIKDYDILSFDRLGEN